MPSLSPELSQTGITDEQSIIDFAHLCYLVFKNTYAGLSENEFLALQKIKARLKSSNPMLDEEQGIAKVIDDVSLFYAQSNPIANSIDKVLQSDFFNYIHSQREADLCHILANNAPSDCGLMYEIPLSEAPALIPDLIKLTKEKPPERGVEKYLKVCNVWQVIESGGKVGFITVAFLVKEKNQKNAMAHKAMLYVEEWLNSQVPVEEELSIPAPKVNRTPFQTSFNMGHVSLLDKVIKRPLLSKLVGSKKKNQANDQDELEVGDVAVEQVEVIDDKNTVVITKDEAQEATKKAGGVINDIQFNGIGYYSVGHGYLVQIQPD